MDKKGENYHFEWDLRWAFDKHVLWFHGIYRCGIVRMEHNVWPLLGMLILFDVAVIHLMVQELCLVLMTLLSRYCGSSDLTMYNSKWFQQGNMDFIILMWWTLDLVYKIMGTYSKSLRKPCKVLGLCRVWLYSTFLRNWGLML